MLMPQREGEVDSALQMYRTMWQSRALHCRLWERREHGVVLTFFCSLQFAVCSLQFRVQSVIVAMIEPGRGNFRDILDGKVGR